MSGSRRELGAVAEDRAAQYLLEAGYTLVTRRYTAHGGELDLVALDGEVLVFVEVKSRWDGGSPESAVTPRKSTRWRRAARHYLQQSGTPDKPHRFDIIAIDRGGLRHHRNVELSSAEVLEHVAQHRSDAVDDELDPDHRGE